MINDRNISFLLLVIKCVNMLILVGLDEIVGRERGWCVDCVWWVGIKVYGIFKCV